jgi:hypothetical protein
MAAMQKTQERENVASREQANQLQQTAQRDAKEAVQAMKSANADWKQQAGQRQDRQAAALSDRLDQKSQELAAYQQQQQQNQKAASPSPTASAEQKAERDVFEQSAQAQRESLESVKAFEQDALKQQADRLIAMDKRQQQERDAVGPSPDARKALDDQQRQEAQLMADRSMAEVRALDEHRSLTNALASREQGQMQAALYQDAPADQRLDQAKQVVDDQDRAQKTLNDRARQQMDEIGKYFDNQLKALQSTKAQFGDIERHTDQKRAVREDQRRVSEHEHIMARINLVLSTIDPKKGMSEYDDKAYRKSATVTIPRDMALEKTADDLALRDRLKEAAETGKYNQQLLNDLSVQAAIDRTIEARERTIAKRQAENKNVDDLRAITNEKIAQAAHYQQSEMFAIDQIESDSKLRADKDLDEQLRRMHEA